MFFLEYYFINRVDTVMSVHTIQRFMLRESTLTTIKVGNFVSGDRKYPI